MAAEKKTAGRVQLESFLAEQNIVFTVTEHPEVFTVEAMLPYLENVQGAICKNLFLKDKKKNFYLFSCLHDAVVNLGGIGKLVKAPGGLRLADESLLEEKLGVKQGHVTAFALLNDTDNNVKFLCDTRLLDGSFEQVSFHPMVNTATLTISCSDFKQFLSAVSYEPICVDLTATL